jgi:hypothetical protein
MLIGAAAIALIVGVGGFAANTAEWVNVLAHVEKEIQLACVDGEGLVSRGPDGEVLDCDFGVVFPQESYELLIELGLSDSFFDQDLKSGVLFDVFWECKLQDEFAPPSATNVCRDTLPDTDATSLDDNIREYIRVTQTVGCRVTGGTPGSGAANGQGAEIEYIGSGSLDELTRPKCTFHLALTGPACTGHLNTSTDPASDPRDVACDEDTSSDDPQDWDISADLGDNFKIQVYGFSN